MRATIDKNSLLKGAKFIQMIPEEKLAPIYSHVLIEASESGSLTITAADYETTMALQIQANVSEPGKTTAPSKRFLEIIKEAPASQIELVSDNVSTGGQLQILAGKSHFQLPTLDPETFPSDLLSNPVTAEPCNPAILEKALTSVLYATSPSNTTIPTLTGICIECDDDLCKFTTSDGFRLARFDIERSSIGLTPCKVILPKKSAQVIVQLLKNMKENEVLVGATNTLFYVSCNGVTLITRSISGATLDFDAILNRNYTHQIEIPVDSFKKALKRMAILTDSTWKYVSLEISENTLRITGGNSEVGMGQEEIEISNTNGKPMRASFNIKYLMEAINIIEGEFLHFRWSQEEEGGLIKDPLTPEYTALVMPVMTE